MSFLRKLLTAVSTNEVFLVTFGKLPLAAMRKFNFLKKKNFWLAAGLVVIFLRGLFLDLMDVDASQYASISMEMLKNGQFLEVQHRHEDYLDKPPLLFWTSAASFFLFGLSNFAYKLPSFLATLAAVFAVYKFTENFYNKKTARHAALIFASSLGLFLVNNDVRTDTLLLATTTLAIWQISIFIEKNKWKNLLAGSFFIGLAMLAKGPIGLVMPCFAIGSHLILTKNWRKILDPRWLVGLVLIALVLLPMCWGLYHQFDLHPEKMLRDRKTSSGLYFYFWEQSFGRVTGDNVWQDDSTPLYFVHTYLWAFLPWSLVFFGAFWSKLRAVFDPFQKIETAENRPEWYSLGGFLLTFLALSMSRYKLPHYIFITLPWAAVMVARFLNLIFSSRSTSRVAFFWSAVQNLSIILTGILAYLIIWYVFPTKNWWVWGIFILTFGCVIFKIFTKNEENAAGRTVKKSVLAAIGFGLILNFWFYPNLLPFQSTAAAGRYFLEKKTPKTNLLFSKNTATRLIFTGNGFPEKLTRRSRPLKFQKKKPVRPGHPGGMAFLFTPICPEK